MIIKLYKTTFLFVLASGLSLTAMSSQAKELLVPVDEINETIKVEIIDTNLARPDKIQINKFKDSLHIVGIIKRKRHNNQRIKGHVDVALLSVDGKVINSQVYSLKYKPGSAKHDHRREFSVVFSIPESDSYRVVIKHHLDQANH